MDQKIVEDKWRGLVIFGTWISWREEHRLIENDYSKEKQGFVRNDFFACLR